MADSLLTARTDEARAGLAEMAAFLTGTLIPHMDAAERTMYPELERMFQLLLRSAGLPEGRRHVAIAGRAGRAHIVDSFYEAEMVIVELYGRRWHLRLDKAAEDRARDNHAAALGYLTVRYLWENVVSQPKLAADNLASVLAMRRRQLRRPAA